MLKNFLNFSIALKLAELGCDIAFVDRSVDFAKRVIFEVNAARRSLAKAYTDYDISDSDDIARLYAAVIRDFGHVDMLITNADCSDESNIDEMIHTNVYGTIMASALVSTHVYACKMLTPCFHFTPTLSRSWNTLSNV